ncbi:RHS repeat domain-containing protein [Sorangium cellulosum]|uniref:RHS repeat domain-containing protein n=1 Tax=Sorangium cellulosum TaxID=56 RepID=UPI0023DDD432|nr:RHS repeat domain-containing protein [Sorangium cellulosum]
MAPGGRLPGALGAPPKEGKESAIPRPRSKPGGAFRARSCPTVVGGVAVIVQLWSGPAGRWRWRGRRSRRARWGAPRLRPGTRRHGARTALCRAARAGGGLRAAGAGGGGGAGGHGAGGGSGGNSAGGGGKSAPDPNRYPECGTVSHPIDVVTGRVFTHAIPICALPGPLPLVWERSYSSAMADRDAGLGHGWGHSLGWEIEVRSHRVRVWTGLGTAVDLPKPAGSEEVLGKWGYGLRREADGWLLDVGDGVKRRFSRIEDGGGRARLTAVEDRNGNRIALTYDEKTGRLVEVTDSAGRRIRLRDRTSGESRERRSPPRSRCSTRSAAGGSRSAR